MMGRRQLRLGLSLVVDQITGILVFSVVYNDESVVDSV